MNDRENEIYKQGAEEVKNTYAFIHDEEFSCEDMADMFLKGAIYADQHPRKGLVDIEKVIEYIKKNSRFEYLLETDWEILEDLRKAMEE